MTLRLFDQQIPRMGLEALGLNAYGAHRWRDALGGAPGLFLVAGPPRSGKTTTAYATLHHLVAEEQSANPFTIEEMTGYRLNAGTQVYTSGRGGRTREKAIAASLRQGADFLFLGEIEDKETLDCARDAAQTGVPTLATLTASDTLTALRRLLALGLPLVSAAPLVRGVLGQRLISYEPPQTPEEDKEAKEAEEAAPRNPFLTRQTGRFELLLPTPELWQAIGKGVKDAAAYADYAFTTDEEAGRRASGWI